MSRLEIKSLPTSKDEIKQPPEAEKNLIPKVGTSCIFSGKSGSGKSTLLVQLVKNFFHGYFDRIFLFSPTAKMDDIQKHLDLDEDDCFDDLTAGIDTLQKILDAQRDSVTEVGAGKAKQYLIIMDDCIGDRDFCSSPAFVKSFIACRHYCLSTWICTQSWTQVPRRCRLQAGNIFMFRGSNSEMEILSQEYCPPGLHKKRFMSIVDFCTKTKHDFLYINMKCEPEKRFRKNLTDYIEMQ